MKTQESMPPFVVAFFSVFLFVFRIVKLKHFPFSKAIITVKTCMCVCTFLLPLTPFTHCTRSIPRLSHNCNSLKIGIDFIILIKSRECSVIARRRQTFNSRGEFVLAKGFRFALFSFFPFSFSASHCKYVCFAVLW